MSDLWPEGVGEKDIPSLNALQAVGIGEGDFDGDEHGVPADALFAYECLEAAEAGFPPEGES